MMIGENTEEMQKNAKIDEELLIQEEKDVEENDSSKSEWWRKIPKVLAYILIFGAVGIYIYVAYNHLTSEGINNIGNSIGIDEEAECYIYDADSDKILGMTTVKIDGGGYKHFRGDIFVEGYEVDVSDSEFKSYRFGVREGVGFVHYYAEHEKFNEDTQKDEYYYSDGFFLAFQKRDTEKYIIFCSKIYDEMCKPAIDFEGICFIHADSEYNARLLYKTLTEKLKEADIENEKSMP